MEIHNVEIRTATEWRAFVDANHDALIDACGTVRQAYRYACNGGLELGGGAAPLFIITLEP